MIVKIYFGGCQFGVIIAYYNLPCDGSSESSHLATKNFLQMRHFLQIEYFTLITITMLASFYCELEEAPQTTCQTWPFEKWSLHCLLNGRSKGNLQWSELGWCLLLDLTDMVEWKCHRKTKKIIKSLEIIDKVSKNILRVF